MLKLKQTNAAFFKASQNLEVSYQAKARHNLRVSCQARRVTHLDAYSISTVEYFIDFVVNIHLIAMNFCVPCTSAFLFVGFFFYLQSGLI